MNVSRFAWLPTWACAFTPFGFISLSVTASLHVRFHYGHWPLDAIDHFDSIALAVHAAAHKCTAMLMFVAPVPWLAFVLVKKFRLPPLHHVAQLVVYVVSFGAAIVLPVSVPGDWVAWFLD
jgi:hypothetical protein